MDCTHQQVKAHEEHITEYVGQLEYGKIEKRTRGM
jgi:hypothetical protein